MRSECNIYQIVYSAKLVSSSINPVFMTKSRIENYANFMNEFLIYFSSTHPQQIDEGCEASRGGTVSQA